MGLDHWVIVTEKPFTEQDFQEGKVNELYTKIYRKKFILHEIVTKVYGKLSIMDEFMYLTEDICKGCLKEIERQRSLIISGQDDELYLSTGWYSVSDKDYYLAELLELEEIATTMLKDYFDEMTNRCVVYGFCP